MLSYRQKQIKAHAKINLYLKINGILDDGYHSISTVMSSISLHDKISVRVSNDLYPKTLIRIRSSDSFIPTGEKNTMYKAADLFLKTLDFKEYPEISIHIKKYIPTQAGLGGGSADAAAVLNTLNELFEYPFTESELISLSSNIGADVPFCMKGGFALCEGKGEIITPLEKPLRLENYAVLVCQSGEHVCTREAYEMYDNYPKKDENAVPFQKFKHDYEKNFKITVRKDLYNSFEAPIFEKYPDSKKIKEMMLDRYALNAMLTGSGSCVYGIFDNMNSLFSCRRKILKLPFIRFCGIYYFQ